MEQNTKVTLKSVQNTDAMHISVISIRTKQNKQLNGDGHVNNMMLNDSNASFSNVALTDNKFGNVTQTEGDDSNGIDAENRSKDTDIQNGKTSRTVKYEIESNIGDETTKSENSKATVPDGGWGWVITFTAFMSGFIIDGISFTFGIFFPHLMDYFGSNRSSTLWIISVLNGTYIGIGPFTSIVLGIFGARKVTIFGSMFGATALFCSTWSTSVYTMTLSYGFLGGLGFGLLYLPPIVMVGQYFRSKRALATGIAVCGSGIGAFVLSPLVEYLIEMYTWKGAMWILAGITLNGVPFALLLRPIAKNISNRDTLSNKKIAEGQTNGDRTNTTSSKVKLPTVIKSDSPCVNISTMFDFDLLRSPTFMVFGCSCFLTTLGFYVPFTFVPAIANDLGMTSGQGAWLISIIGITNTLGRVVVGWVADRTWADAVLVHCYGLIIGGLASIFVPYYLNFTAMAIYCIVFGATIGIFVSLKSAIVADLFGVEKLASSLGLVNLVIGLSAFIGTPIAGALSDNSGNYNTAFYFAGGTMLVAGGICLPLRRLNRRETHNKKQTTSVQRRF